MSQSNAISKKSYRGKNQARLQLVKEANNYQSDEWITFLQARDLSRKIKKGSHGVAIFRGVEKVPEGEKEIERQGRSLGFARVFNLDQTELIEAKK